MEIILALVVIILLWKYRELILVVGGSLLILAILVSLFGPFFIGLVIVILVIAALYEMCK